MKARELKRREQNSFVYGCDKFFIIRYDLKNKQYYAGYVKDPKDRFSKIFPDSNVLETYDKVSEKEAKELAPHLFILDNH